MRFLFIGDIFNNYKLLKPTLYEDFDAVFLVGGMSLSNTIPGSKKECYDTLKWFDSIPVEHKYYMAGGYDIGLFYKMDLSAFNTITRVSDGLIDVKGVSVYMCEHTITYAYPTRTKTSIARNSWYNIPDNLDILVTANAPKGILDEVHGYNNEVTHYGATRLFQAVRRKKPKYHVFAGICDSNHDTIIIRNHGKRQLSDFRTKFVNCTASKITQSGYNLINRGVVINLKNEKTK